MLFGACGCGLSMPISSTVIITETERKEAELKNGQRKLSLKYPSLLKEGVDFEGDSNLIPSKKRLYSDDIPMGDVWKQQKEAIASGHDDGGKGGEECENTGRWSSERKL